MGLWNQLLDEDDRCWILNLRQQLDKAFPEYQKHRNTSSGFEHFAETAQDYGMAVVYRPKIVVIKGEGFCTYD